MTSGDEESRPVHSAAKQGGPLEGWHTWSGSPLVLTGVAAMVMVAVLIVVVRLSLDPATANHDVAWTLYAGGQLLDGAEYGVDIIELNPPFILWIGALATALARLVGAPVILLYNLLVLLLVAGLGVALWRLLLRAFGRSDIPAAIATVMVAALAYIPGYEFGQRDHVIFLLITPHLLLCALSVDGGLDIRRGARIAAGAAMGAALCMKPHYALAWLAAELAMQLRSGSPKFLVRPENWTAVGSCLAYGAYFIALDPRYFEAMRAAMALYKRYDAPIAIFDERLALLFACLVLLLLVRPGGAAGRCAVVSFAASLAGLAVVILQGKGYPYHYLPCQLSALLGVACSVGAWLGPDRDSLQRSSYAGLAFGLAAAQMAALAMAASLLLQGIDREYPANRELVKLIEANGRAEPVLFLSSSVSPTFPVLTITGNLSASPYPCVWQIAGYYSPAELARPEFPYRTLEEMSGSERQLVTTVVDRMERDTPRLVFLDKHRSKYSFRGARFAFERYFSADPRFEILLRRYRSLGVVGGYLALVLKDGEEISHPEKVQSG